MYCRPSQSASASIHAGELEEADRDGELGGLVDAVAGPGALGEDDERDGADLRVVHLGHLAGGVVGADVGDLVGHDAGKFGFFVGGQDEAGVDVEESAGQRHGVDLVGVDDLDGEGDFAVGVLDDVLADAVDVLDDDGVGDEVGGLLNLHGVLLAVADLPVGGVPVAHAAAADVACAYGVDVVFAAGLDVGIEVFAGRGECVGFVFRLDLLGGVFALFGRGGGMAGDGLLGGDVSGDVDVGGGVLVWCGLRGVWGAVWGCGLGCGCGAAGGCVDGGLEGGVVVEVVWGERGSERRRRRRV